MFDTAPALFTDQYTLTMAQSFWKRERNDLVTFELFVRSLPADHAFLLAAGLDDALTYLENLRFTAEQIDYLAGLPAVQPAQDPGAPRLFDPGFLDFLSRLRFTGEVVAVPEGTVITAQVPVLRVTAPRIQASIIESALLSIINFSTRIATTAARAVIAADGRPVLDMALRRLDGPEGAIAVARSAWLAGFAGTAVPAAAMKLGIPVFGTMAHHYVMSYGEDAEQQAFEDFLRDYPHGTTLLVDTYDTLRGVRRAIAASEAAGVALKAIRLDSGDLTQLSFQARAILDDAGFADTKIVVSNDLDPRKIDALVSAGAPVDMFGMGTMLRAHPPTLGGVFKITEQHGDHTERFIMKKAPGKQTDPGAHQVFRTADGQMTLGMANELLDGTMLMRPVMKAGERYGDQPSLSRIREHAARELAALPQAARRINNPQPLTLNRSSKLLALRAALGDTAAIPTMEPALA